MRASVFFRRVSSPCSRTSITPTRFTPGGGVPRGPCRQRFKKPGISESASGSGKTDGRSSQCEIIPLRFSDGVVDLSGEAMICNPKHCIFFGHIAWGFVSEPIEVLVPGYVHLSLFGPTAYAVTSTLGPTLCKSTPASAGPLVSSDHLRPRPGPAQPAQPAQHRLGLRRSGQRTGPLCRLRAPCQHRSAELVAASTPHGVADCSI
jgi:hypothetical protein